MIRLITVTVEIDQTNKVAFHRLIFLSHVAEKRKTPRKSDDGLAQEKVDSQQDQQTEFESVSLTLVLLHIYLQWVFSLF